jgi:hypothetical protein
MVIKTNISLTDMVVQGKGNIVSDMGAEKVMLSVKNGKYYNLGEIGGYIWGLLESPALISDVVKALISIYHVEEVDCEKQVLAFVEHLFEEGLIEKR